MERNKRESRGITLVALVVTIIILLVLAGITIATLGGENGLLSKVKLGKERYAISEAKEKIEMEITNLQIEKQGNGEELKKEDLPKMNSDEIDVRDTTNFPVEVICGNYKFEVDDKFKVKYIGEVDGTVITYTTEPEGYTNQEKIKILIKISSNKGIKSVLKPGETDKLLAQGQKNVGIDFEVTKNGHYELKVEDMEGNETVKDIYIDQIDTVEPQDFTISASKNDGKIVISGEAQDGDATETSTKSGIDHYEYCFVDEANAVQKYTEKEIPESELAGTYNIYAIAYDRAGNSKKSNTVQVTVMDTVISAGYDYSLIIDNNGDMWAWGRNDYGQIGDETTIDKASPVQIKIGTKYKRVSAGNKHSLAIDSEGNLWTWGRNDYGQLGDGTTTQKKSPIQIKSGTKFTQISEGYYHSLAIDSQENLWAWGNNYSGQLGDGTTVDKIKPLQIKTGTKFIQVSAAFYQSLLIDINGNLWTWGGNDYGQLGDGTTIDKHSPEQIKAGTKFTQVSAGRDHSLAIDSEGNLWAWGINNYGQLGDGTTENRTLPVQIKTGTKFMRISAGSNHNLAIDSEGKLWTWGYNGYGQLGDGTTTNRTLPVQIKTGTKFTQISAGGNHNLAIDSKGKLWTWGHNGYGQLGDGTTIDKHSPEQIR